MEVKVTQVQPSNFIGTIFKSRDMAHLFHLRTTSLTHTALNEYYDDILEAVDGFVETYQGRNGLLNLSIPSSIITNSDKAIPYFRSVAIYIETNRNIFAASYLQNQIDTMLEIVYRLLFKLEQVNNQI
jgi:hypothetical protein